MATTNKTTAARRILKALQTGYDFTPDQLRSRFGIRRVSDRVSELRKAGYPVYLNTKTTANGEKIRVYKLGTSSRREVVTGQVVEDFRSQGYNYINLYDLQANVDARLNASF